MCRKVSCKACEKPTWAGCGAHIESVLGSIAPKDRCCCDRSASAGGFLGKLFGGR